MHRQSGVTLIELMVVVAIGALLLGTTLVYSLHWMAQETMHAAAKDLQAFMQLTKMEAISRNRDCRFVLDRQNGLLEVWDAAGTTADPSDDEQLHTRTLPQSVRFARPDQGINVITLPAIAGGRHEVLFASDGIVANGGGAIHVHGGEQYGRVTVYIAGGVEIEYWNGSNWENGS